MGGYDMAAILHPDVIEQVLTEDFDSFRKSDNADGVDVLADGLSLSDGEQWQRHRTRLQSIFYRWAK